MKPQACEVCARAVTLERLQFATWFAYIVSLDDAPDVRFLCPDCVATAGRLVAKAVRRYTVWADSYVRVQRIDSKEPDPEAAGWIRSRILG